jgi:hypothetical protein
VWAWGGRKPVLTMARLMRSMDSLTPVWGRPVTMVFCMPELEQSHSTSQRRGSMPMRMKE